MRTRPVRPLLTVLSLAGTALAIACSSGPQEEPVASTSGAIIGPGPHCPVGSTAHCIIDANGNQVCDPCKWIDGYFAITQKAQAPNPNATDTTCSLDTSPHPYPTELVGMGCTQTAVFHNRTNDTVGGRVVLPEQSVHAADDPDAAATGGLHRQRHQRRADDHEPLPR